MATRTRTKKVADTAATAAPVERCEPHGVKGTCWRCCEADMAAHLVADGRDPSKYFDNRNGEGTPDQGPRGNGGGNASSRTAETATENQVWKIRTERDRRVIGALVIPADADIPKMSKRAASKLISDLVACDYLPFDQRPGATVARTNAPDMTDAQRYRIEWLLTERQTTEVMPEHMTVPEASAMIDRLNAAPRLVDVIDVADGMYYRDGIIYRVKRRADNGRLQCHRAVIVAEAIRDDDGTTIVTPARVKFRSALAEAASLTTADLMTIDQARAFGALYGSCAICGLPLSNEDSVAAGIGPKCAEKFGGRRGNGQTYDAPADVTPVRRSKTRKTAATTEAHQGDAYVSPWASL